MEKYGDWTEKLADLAHELILKTLEWPKCHENVNQMPTNSLEWKGKEERKNLILRIPS